MFVCTGLRIGWGGSEAGRAAAGERQAINGRIMAGRDRGVDGWRRDRQRLWCYRLFVRHGFVVVDVLKAAILDN
jgi:hypothetical protein